MRNLFYMGLLMFGTISSGFAGDKVGNGGFYLPKNDQGEPITVELGVSHPKNPELFDLIDQSRLPLELKEWLKDDLCSVAIYYSNEIVRKKNIDGGAEKGTIENEPKWFPEHFQISNDTVLAAYTIPSERVVVYFLNAITQLPEQDIIALVLHEAIHRLHFWFHELAYDERFVFGLSELIKQDLFSDVSDPQMQERYTEIFSRFKLPSYKQLPKSKGGMMMEGLNKQTISLKKRISDFSEIYIFSDPIFKYIFPLDRPIYEISENYAFLIGYNTYISSSHLGYSDFKLPYQRVDLIPSRNFINTFFKETWEKFVEKGNYTETFKKRLAALAQLLEVTTEEVGNPLLDKRRHRFVINYKNPHQASKGFKDPFSQEISLMIDTFEEALLEEIILENNCTVTINKVLDSVYLRLKGFYSGEEEKRTMKCNNKYLDILDSLAHELWNAWKIAAPTYLQELDSTKNDILFNIYYYTQKQLTPFGRFYYYNTIDEVEALIQD